MSAPFVTLIYNSAGSPPLLYLYGNLYYDATNLSAVQAPDTSQLIPLFNIVSSAPFLSEPVFIITNDGGWMVIVSQHGQTKEIIRSPGLNVGSKITQVIPFAAPDISKLATNLDNSILPSIKLRNFDRNLYSKLAAATRSGAPLSSVIFQPVYLPMTFNLPTISGFY